MSIRAFLPLILALLTAGFASGCGGGPGGGAAASAGPAPVTVIATADVNLLFMGNSHTAVNNVPGMVAAMVRAGQPGKTVMAVEAPGSMFLDQRVNDAATLGLLRSQNWSYVVLQAQQYSSSGQFTYSTAEAEELVRLSRRQNAVPVMFPEWPRRGINETQRIFDLHVSIARNEPVCVPPIPQAWDLALARHPTLVLHSADGNHSAPPGAFLAALVLYATITGLPPSALPELSQPGVDADTQAKLRAVASETVNTISPRLYCPNDRVG